MTIYSTKATLGEQYPSRSPASLVKMSSLKLGLHDVDISYVVENVHLYSQIDGLSRLA